MYSLKQTTSGLLLVLCFLAPVNSGLTDYVNNIASYFKLKTDDSVDIGEGYTQRIPYEVSISDEKFISEAAKLTGVALSELDSCQQRVVLRLQMDCDKLNDEQLAKMAVHLLNCQSFVEGRPIFPCTESMSIKECTTKMDSDTWTSYHLMSNRARAVCYSIRQIQFRGLAEHTVNRLMDAAQNQLKTLGKIAENQEDLQITAQHTLSSISKGHELLTQQQKDLQKAQFYGQLALEDNIRKLGREKELILEAHNYLVEMTAKIQKRLEESSKLMETQAEESRDNHVELLDDLIALQNRARIIFEKIEESSHLLVEQNDEFRRQYEATLQNLAEVNATVHSLVTLVGGTRQALEEKLQWLTTTLGGTDSALEQLYLILWHTAFIMVAMLTSAFLSARPTTRLIVATLPPLNLAVALWGFEHRLGPIHLSLVILLLILMQTLVFWVISLGKSSGKPEKSDMIKEAPAASFKEEPDEEHEKMDFFSDDLLGSPTPPLSRSDFYKNQTRSRSNTPVIRGDRGACKANTRAGTPCKLSSLVGRDFCYRHQNGDSVMG